MAEIIVSALLPIVFDKLTSAAFTKVARSKEIQSQLKKLETSLPPIQALLNDAAEKEIQDRRVKGWLNRLQHVAYDIDDVLDSLATDAIHRDLTEKPAGGITRKVRKIIPACCTTTFSSSSNTEMHHKLNDITTKLQQLYDEKTNLGLEVKDRRSKNINRIHQTALLTPGIVGRQGEKEFLLQKLLGDEPIANHNNFSIVPIVGMGGMGKTTLARLLYNEPKVEEHFKLKAWVCVSDEFDSFNIGKVIFQSIVGEEKKQMTFADLNLLQQALRNELAGKKFLLVLDDVWTDNIKDWNALVPPFHAAARGSKIIITTRKTQLLQQLGNDKPYHLNKLSHEDALSLFAQHALDATNFDSYPTLRPYGEGIVQKCDGLPLALMSLGTSLKTITDEEDWNELLTSKIWNLKDEGGILPALRLSYQELPACLKQLFAYSSLFPKDYVFEKEDLILLWMAEGFLHESTEGDSKEMERLGEKFFDELLSRSFFEYVNNDRSLFVMHDLMNDLATSVAGEFFVRLDIEMKNKIEKDCLKKCRHMSFVREEFMAFKKFKVFEEANSLRTFLAVPVVPRENNWQKFYFSHKILVDLLPKFPLLRALSLSKLEIDEVPESVGDLKHLRYLNLSQTPITYLPENVCNLYNLQTLIVVGCRKLGKLPNSFLKLINLRHFDIRDTPLLKNMPLGISEIKSLQTLSKIVIGGENEFPISGLKHLKNLRQKVHIQGLDKFQNNDQAPEVNLSQMKLSELVVEWSDVFDGTRKEVVEKEVLDVLKPHSDNMRKLEILSYGGREFPEWVGDSLFRQLTDVTIKNCKNCKFLPPLEHMPSLKKLSIESMDSVKEVESELLWNGPASFPSLEVLSFEDMPGWEVWSVNAVGVAVFPCLKELRIRKCPNMARWEVWSDVGVFPCLEELVVYDCPKLGKVSVEALPALRVLNVERCGEGVLKSLVGVASSVTKLYIKNISGVSEEFTCKVSLPSLRVLRIHYCGEGVLKSLVGVASSSVTELSLWGISGLGDEVWRGVVQYLGALEQLTMWNCDEIRNLWGSEEEEEACKEVLVNLKKLEIRRCEKLVKIGGEKEEEEGSNLPTSLRNLEIKYCKNLKHLSCPDSIETLDIRRNLWESEEACKEVLVNLKKLEISFCHNLMRIGRGGGGVPTSLRMLGIYQCKNLKHLSCPDSIETLNVVGCWNLEHLSCAANSIQELRVSGCGSIKSVSFPTEGGGGGGGLQKLKSLEIEGPNSEVLEKELEKQMLKNIPPMLQLLHIENLNSIMEFNCVIQQLTELKIEDCGRIESFPNLQNLTSLKHLTITNCPNMEGPPALALRSGGGVSVSGVWPPKLDSLTIGRLKRPISEWGPLPTSSSLVRLTLLGGFGSSSSTAEEEEDVKSFPTSSLLPYSSSSSSLSRLVLREFKKMERISSEGLQHLTSLQHLTILDCPNLKDLPETLLPSLSSLYIYFPNEELKEKMMSRRRGSYWPLLSHIPNVYID